MDERITEEVMLLFVLLFVRLGDVLEAGIARLWFVRGGRVACAKFKQKLIQMLENLNYGYWQKMNV